MTSTTQEVEPEFLYLSNLTDDELRAAADAFGTKKGLRGVVMKDLRENGVTQDLYNREFTISAPPAGAPVESVETLSDVLDELEAPVVVAPAPAVVTASREVLPQADYLIKMERENPLFEYGRYKFTRENPYQIMNARDAQGILSKEKGFRQAFPEELEEYYS